MAKLLFKLNQVPEDEADEVRALLDAANIDYYETSAGKWGISMAAIWLPDEAEWPRAQALLEDYSARRAEQMRAQYQTQKAAGELPTWWQKVKAQPQITLIVLFALVVILYISLVPFVHFLP